MRAQALREALQAGRVVVGLCWQPSIHRRSTSRTPRPVRASARTRVRIGSEARALFIAGIDEAEFAFLELIVEAAHVIAGNGKSVARTVRVELLDEILADGARGFHGSGVKASTVVSAGQSCRSMQFPRGLA